MAAAVGVHDDQVGRAASPRRSTRAQRGLALGLGHVPHDDGAHRSSLLRRAGTQWAPSGTLPMPSAAQPVDEPRVDVAGSGEVTAVEGI